MKAYISEGELYPCYGVGLMPGTHDAIVDVSEEKIREWRRASRAFHQAQEEIRYAIGEYERKLEEIKHLESCFAKINPSRQDKGYILQKYGWNQIDTSLWQKDGRQVRLHEAYNECRQEFENEKAESA